MAEGECDSLKTVDCLRGRLLAERLASRSANDEADKLENKVMELEDMLKREVKSKNRAEKRTELLLKKLDSMNIMGKSVISHTPSTCSSESSFPSTLTGSGSEGQNRNSLFSQGDLSSEKPSPSGSDRSDVFDRDDSMALVVIDDKPGENRSGDQDIHDSNAVQEVLDALKCAKAQLRSSMEKRQLDMIRVS